MADPNRLRVKTGAIDHGRLYEPRLAKSIGARLRPNSGAVQGKKGDMVLPEWLIEVKTTVNDSMKVNLGWLVKITEEATRAKKLPLLSIGFVLNEGRPRPNCSSEWVAMPLHVFQELTGTLVEK